MMEKEQNRLETILRQHSLTIETPLIFSKSFVSTPFTLHFQGRTLQDTMQSKTTITPIQALTTLFNLSNAGRLDPAFRRMSKQKEKALKKLLGNMYNTFWQAFSQDLQEQRGQQQAESRAAFAAAPSADELVFIPGERVRFPSDRGGLREEDWIYAKVIEAVWQCGARVGILVRRDDTGREEIRLPQSLQTERQWKKR